MIKIVKLSKLSKIAKNCQNFQNCKNCQKWSKIVKMLVRSCFLITVIKCLKGQWSLGSLFNVKNQKVAHWVTQWVSEWKCHLLSCPQTQGKNPRIKRSRVTWPPPGLPYPFILLPESNWLLFQCPKHIWYL